MRNAPLSRASATSLQAAIVLAGAAVLAFLLWEPNVEGVNADAASLSEVYFDDPFLAYVYAGSIPFFVALYQAFRAAGSGLRGSAGRLRTIKRCALLLVALIAGAEAWIVLAMGGSDDIAGGVAMGLLATAACVAMAAVAAWLEKASAAASRGS